MALGRFVLCFALLTAAGCTSSVVPSPPPSPSAAAEPSREPASLPELPWEREIIDGLRREGIVVTLVGGSKFETDLGPRLPARVFIVRPGAGGAGADVLFLDRPLGEIRVCTTRRNDGFWANRTTIDGRVVSRSEGTQQVLFSVSERFFVQAVGESFHEAIMKVTGTSRPKC